MKLLLLAFACALLVAVPSRSFAQTRGAFVMTMGADTVALERFERDGDRLSGVTLFKMMNLRTDWTLESAPDGSARRMHLEARYANTPLDAKPLQEGTLEFRADSVVAVLAGASALPVIPARVCTMVNRLPRFCSCCRRSVAASGQDSSASAHR